MRITIGKMSIVAAVALLAVTASFAATVKENGRVLQGPYTAPKSSVAIGSTCQRRTDNAAGVVKMDACKRVYCGRADTKDIIEIMPNFAAINRCTWTLMGTHCKCKRART
jgi:hypothetical protein